MPAVQPRATSTRLLPAADPRPRTAPATTPLTAPTAAVMTAADIIADPDLRAVLDAASLAQQQCDALLAVLAEHPLPPPTSPSSESGTQNMPPDVAEQISSAQKALHAHLAAVRNQNRKALLSVRSTKHATADARHEVDTLHLALQNLYYEQRHLESEIKACQGYDHPYQKLPLMAEEEFVAAFPEVVEGCREAAQKAVGERREMAEGGEQAGEDVGMEGGEEDAAYEEEMFEDALMKARIEQEHKERLALEEKRQGLLKKKQGLIAENNKRKEDLAKLDESLEKFIEAAKPIEQTFQKEY
ncbi:tho complex subunit 5 [Diplodia corticola]|uniref:Tho complex subunit 5 n=1 Tax=Diplodia corticola TaxID=236234 RepID=A0A1J9RZC7_9PEZI|nr:tho complex subunit 5 [Diplodia corticola]OJD32805.1 tho complex subunit 5 [Diplodia corticola]